jgi:hypothetical protein
LLCPWIEQVREGAALRGVVHFELWSTRQQGLFLQYIMWPLAWFTEKLKRSEGGFMVASCHEATLATGPA